MPGLMILFSHYLSWLTLPLFSLASAISETSAEMHFHCFSLSLCYPDELSWINTGMLLLTALVREM